MTFAQFASPLVSVVIPAYNGQEFIRDAIRSALAQTYRPIEILVIDDGSPINMEPAVAGFGPEVRYMRQENGGTASARNLGWRSAGGEFIALLDQDDLWLPHKLERQVPRFAEDPRIGLVAAWMEVFDTSTGEPKGTYKPAPEMTVHDMLGHELPPVQTMIFRKSALDKIGGFDASLRGTDDWDVNIRIAAEYRVVSVQEVLGRARMHSAQQGSNGEQMYRNSVRVLEKHRHVHPGCAECAAALRKSRRLVREYHSLFIKDRARAAWKEGRYTAAITRVAHAFWQHPPVVTRAVGNAFRKF
jgi:glycosyltransferase involved in cell wall biosynthesis